MGTITAGSSPLYVVDGIPLSDDTGNATGISVSPIASISDSDIESIEVLKDASAAAIYGSRGMSVSSCAVFHIHNACIYKLMVIFDKRLIDKEPTCAP